MNIYVGNLQYSLTGDDLREIFEEYGKVDSAKVITDRETGRSKGFGFIEMEDENEAKTAVDELNQAEINGRVVKVNIARERASKPSFKRY